MHDNKAKTLGSAGERASGSVEAQVEGLKVCASLPLSFPPRDSFALLDFVLAAVCVFCRRMLRSSRRRVRSSAMARKSAQIRKPESSGASELPAGVRTAGPQVAGADLADPHEKLPDAEKVRPRWKERGRRKKTIR